MDSRLAADQPAPANQILLIISASSEFLSQARMEFDRRHQSLQIAAVSGIDAAREILESKLAAAILLEEAPLADAATAQGRRTPTLWAAVTSLAEHAPVVVIGCAEHQSELTDLLASGVADYVTRSDGSLNIAAGMIERRLRQKKTPALRPIEARAKTEYPKRIPAATAKGRDFGEILRHELNNPLTGILGNAELLLVELRRSSSDVPANVTLRLETIASLAVRMRETVRRLSEECETGGEKSDRGMVTRAL